MMLSDKQIGNGPIFPFNFVIKLFLKTFNVLVLVTVIKKNSGERVFVP